MRWFDRAMLVVLAGLFVMLVGAAVTLVAKVEATADTPIPTVTIVEEPTTAPPRTCVVSDDPDTNWAARFGVHDRTCS